MNLKTIMLKKTPQNGRKCLQIKHLRRVHYPELKRTLTVSQQKDKQLNKTEIESQTQRRDWWLPWGKSLEGW